MSDPHLQLIENHIKDLLFNKKDPTAALSPPNHKKEDRLNNYSLNSYSFPDKPFLPTAEENSDKLKWSMSSLDCNFTKHPTDGGSSSQLIDVNVLTDFAARHADISDMSQVLPHPELENDPPASPDAGNHPKMVFSDNVVGVKKNKNHGKVASKSPFAKTPGESRKNVERNSVRTEVDVERDRKKKKKRTRKQNAEEKFNPRSPVKGEGTESSKLNKNKHYSAHKESSALKKEITSPPHLEDVPNPLTRVPVPVGEKEYTLTNTKEGCKFVCHLCNHDIKVRDYINKHLSSETHREIKKEIQADRVLPFLPRPLPSQIEAISEVVLRCHAEHGLQDEDLSLRQKVADRLTDFIKKHLTGCSIDMIGSSVTRLGLKDSKVDFVFKVEEEQNIPDSLELLYNKLLSDCDYCNVTSVFDKKHLGILFTDKETGLECSLVLENGFSEKLARLFAIYSELHPSVRILATCFRYWAKVCSLDNQDCGTLPSYTFSILLVYFLQQTEPPVLPVLNEIKEYGNADFVEKYVEAKVWKSENECSVGELWLQLFYFYNFVYEMGKHVVCVRTANKVICSEKNWSTKFYAIEDPFSRRNIAHVIPNFQVFQYIRQCFLKTYRYFAFPLLKDGQQIKLRKTEEFETLLMSYASAQSEAKDDSDDESGPSDNEDSSFNDELGLDLDDHDPDLPLENLLSTMKSMSVDEKNETALELQATSKKLDSPKKDSKVSREKAMKAEERNRIRAACSWDLRNVNASATFHYQMEPTLFKGKKDVPFSCRQCKSTEHLKKNCPVDDLPPPLPLPEMTSEFVRVINKTLYYIRDKNSVDAEDRDFIMNNMMDIELYIQKLFPEARLSMFGSFCNGFGFKSRSDMDFCLTFTDHEDSKKLDCTEVIESLAKHLQQFPRLESIVPVTSAKVPIVKFACTESGLEGDISLYNTLAIANTEMLELYSRIDDRVQVLGFALKYFAKMLGICDASRGSLSSYAYILMVLYFLQQRQPAVIPVLQELYEEEKPSRLVDGWNVWFYKDLDKLPIIWPDYGKNKENVADLWLGLLHFYAYEFEWQKYVVSIRQRARLTRFRKLWITDQIAIEDPFDLSHNLGAGLSRKMNMYILKTFVRGRERFGSPLPMDDLSRIFNREVSYLFDRRFLNSGMEPPHDRGCRACGKIGHIAKNCTRDRLCLLCKKPGHLAKSCPKGKDRKGKSNSMDKNHQDPFLVYNGRNNGDALILPGHSLPPQSSDGQRSNNNKTSAHILPMGAGDRERKLLQMGFPTHRHPPPGFPKNFPNPPPGFAIHQNSAKFSPRFPSSCPAPFPRNIGNLSQSPPKHYSCSPPKNFLGGNVYHPEPISIRPELHNNPMMHRIWQMPGNRMPPQFSDRRKRTN